MSAFVRASAILAALFAPAVNAQVDIKSGRQAVVIEQIRATPGGPEQRARLAGLVKADETAAFRSQVGVWELSPDVDFNALQRRLARDNYPFRAISLTTAPDLLSRSVGTTQIPGFAEPAHRLEFPKLDVFRPIVTGVSVDQAEAISERGSKFDIYKSNGLVTQSTSRIRATPPVTTFRIELSPDDSMRLALTSISAADEGNVRASFSWLDGDGVAFLQRSRDGVFGSVRRGSDVFAIVTTAGGDTLAQRMPALSEDIHPSAGSTVVPCSGTTFSNLVGNPEFVPASAEGAGEKKALSVLFVATRELQQKISLPVLWSFAKQSLIGLDNQFALQKIPLTAAAATPEVVGLTYSESCNGATLDCWKRLCRDVIAGTGEMASVHAARDQYKADIVILLVERTDARGLSADIGAPAKHAFIVVAYNALGAPDTVAHEIAHIAGAYHHPTCDATPGIPGRHGYRSADRQQATLEAGVCRNPVSRVQTLWSDPTERMLGGYPGGDTCCNTSGLLRGAAARLAGFR